MAKPDETPAAEGNEAAAVGQRSAPRSAQLYTIERLIADSRDFLGVEPFVAAGAFHGSSDKELTLADAKQTVRDWLKKPVETGGEG